MFVGRMASPVGNYVIQCFLRTAMITQIGKNLIQSLICPFCIKHNPCQIINVIIIEYTASYAYFSSIQKNQLRVETELAAQGVALSGADYFDGLNDGNYRITWVSPEGDVLFDDEADTATMQNHMERPEIRQALKEGYGEAARHSYTLADQQYYAAKRLPDGSVLRMSVAQLSVWSLLIGFGQPICFVILAALILSYVLASRIAAKIVKPINELDLTHPAQYYGKQNYEEIQPLLRHIAAQQAQLKRDQEEIEKAALIRQEFSANVSHELKTPLNAISR